jgi:hypothetical protein
VKRLKASKPKHTQTSKSYSSQKKVTYQSVDKQDSKKRVEELSALLMTMYHVLQNGLKPSLMPLALIQKLLELLGQPQSQKSTEAIGTYLDINPSQDCTNISSPTILSHPTYPSLEHLAYSLTTNGVPTKEKLITWKPATSPLEKVLLSDLEDFPVIINELPSGAKSTYHSNSKKKECCGSTKKRDWSIDHRRQGSTKKG